MGLIEKIPAMSDAEVINLLANARRLQESGDERQQHAAGEILPALEEAAAHRRQERLAAAQVKRSISRKAKAAA